MTDNLDLDTLRLPPEMAGEHCAAVHKKIQKQRQHFIKVPMAWDERLYGARHAITYNVAHYLLYRHWKGNGQPILLANEALRMRGVERRAKWRALRELEQLGLISIERRRRKSPLITVLV